MYHSKILLISIRHFYRWTNNAFCQWSVYCTCRTQSVLHDCAFKPCLDLNNIEREDHEDLIPQVAQPGEGDRDLGVLREALLDILKTEDLYTEIDTTTLKLKHHKIKNI